MEFQPFALTARETKRVDVDLNIAAQATSVTVEALPVVQTDVSNIAETKGTLELTDLPVAITTRSFGSTSAFSTLTAQPGLQTDGYNIMVAGAGPSQISISIELGAKNTSHVSDIFSVVRLSLDVLVLDCPCLERDSSAPIGEGKPITKAVPSHLLRFPVLKTS
jgi:hypothetical protein